MSANNNCLGLLFTLASIVVGIATIVLILVAFQYVAEIRQALDAIQTIGPSLWTG